MIESIENALQIAVLLACISISLYRAVTQRSRAWTMLSFFYGSQVLGDIYWLVCLIFYHDTPRIFPAIFWKIVRKQAPVPRLA